jgi:hypothetical protein
MVAIAAILMNSCEIFQSKVAKMEQISINGSNYGLEVLNSDSILLHPKGTDGTKGFLLLHKGGPVYISGYNQTARAKMIPPDFYKKGELTIVVLNLDLKKIIIEFEWPGTIRVLPTEELVVPGGKVCGLIVISYSPYLSTERQNRKVYTLDGALLYDNRKEYSDLVIEGGYIYDVNYTGYLTRSPEKVNKVLPDGSKEPVRNLKKGTK